MLRVLSADVDLVRRLFPLRQELQSANDTFNQIISHHILPIAAHLEAVNQKQLVEPANSEMGMKSITIEAKAKDLMTYLVDHYATIKELEQSGALAQ